MVLSPSAASTTNVFLFCLCLLLCRGGSSYVTNSVIFMECENETIRGFDADQVNFAKNLEYFEAEYFSWAAFGHGLDYFRPELAKGGPPPIGGQKANLSYMINDLIGQFALQEWGHLRAIETTVNESIPRPLLNISREAFATVMNNAFEKPLMPPFDPYEDDIKYLLSVYIIPYVGLNGYVGSNPNLKNRCAKALVAGLLGIESAQDALTRTLLYERAFEKVHPYDITVEEFTNRISWLRNNLGRKGIKDEGLIVPPELGAEERTEGNVFSGDQYSLSYARTPKEIASIVYGTGNASCPGLFYPEGANGRIANYYLYEAKI